MTKSESSPVHRPRRRFFVWFLPVIWGVTSFAATTHSGDEHGLWLVGSLPGVWTEFFVRSQGESIVLMRRAIAIGVATLVGFGWLMDRARVWRVLWLACWLTLGAIICVTMLKSHPTYARAISKNGSLLAYILAASNLSLTITSLFMLAGFGLGALTRRRKFRPGFCESCGYNLTGNVSGRCPECGTPIAAAPPAS